MTHQRGPLLWTIAIFDFADKLFDKNGQRTQPTATSPTGSLLPSLTPHTHSLPSFSISENFILLFWVSSLSSWTSSTTVTSSCHWPSARGSSGAANGLFFTLFCYALILLNWDIFVIVVPVFDFLSHDEAFS